MSSVSIGTIFHQAIKNGYQSKERQLDNDVIDFINQSVTREQALDISDSTLQQRAEFNPNATSYDILTIGFTPNTENQFIDIVEYASELALYNLNEEHAVVQVSGKTSIIREKLDPVNNAPTYDLRSNTDFEKWYINRTFYYTALKDGQYEIKSMNIAKKWLGWKHRREYKNGLIMAPEKPLEFDGYYNIFRGFPIEPVKGDWRLFQRLIRDGICSGNTDHYRFLMDWIASLFQHPDIRYGVAPVLRGDKGIGKGVLAKYLGQLLGSHYIALSNEHHLTGNFNGHLASSMLVFADELTWGGNKKNEGPLKSLITEDTLMLEHKGFDAIQVRNHVRLIVASNDSWAVPATAGERRWFVLDCSNKFKGNTEFWDSVHLQMDSGGINAFMHHLLHRKITTNQRIAPVTKALSEIALKSLTDIQRWLFDFLSNVSFEERHQDLSNRTFLWPELITARILYSEYCSHFSKTNHHGHPEPIQVVMKETKQLLNLGPPRKKYFGPSNTRCMVYKLPMLKDARDSFNKETNLVLDWPDIPDIFK